MGVAEQLDDLLLDAPAPVEGAVVAAVRSDLEAVAGRAVALVDGHDAGEVLPLRLPKSRVVALGDCERFAVSRDGADDDGAVSPAVVRGHALDAYVGHELHEGPVADPVGDLVSMLRVQDRHDLADAVEGSCTDDELAPLAAAARDWSGVDPAWWPRTQSSAAVHLAGGAVRCEGRADVELGGPLSGRPGVVVEVKAGRPHRNHLAEVTHYALLVALRDGTAPAFVARWYPGAALAHLPVTADVVRTGARQLAASIDAWTELQVGRPPRESPGPSCGWCPDADRCPSFQAPPDPFDPSERAA